MNPRKTFAQVVSLQACQIQIDYGVFCIHHFHFMHDGPGHHIVRREFGHRMVLGHEVSHFQVAQVSAPLEQGLRQQKGRRFLQI